MRLQVSLPTEIAEKLNQIALQELRPIALQAEYMLCRAVQRARCKSKTISYHDPEVDALDTEVTHATS